MLQAEELGRLSIFACLDQDHLERLSLKAADLHLETDEYLTREGEQPHFFVLIEGTVRLMKNVMGRETDILEQHSGDFFGELAILMGTLSPISLRAKTKCRVARFEIQHLQDLIRESTACSALILQALNERLIYAQQYMSRLPSARVVVVGSQYDTDCRDIRAFLSLNRIPYEWMDRMRTSPLILSCLPADAKGPEVVIDNAYCLREPTVRNVAEALGLRTAPTGEEYDVVVIGAGPAGLASAVYGSSEGLRVLLVERNAAGGQAGASSRIENYLGFPNGISGDELSDRAFKQAMRFGAEIVLTRTVRKVVSQPNGCYRILLDGGDQVCAKTVILASGVDWRKIEAEGLDRLIGRGVLYGAARTEAATVLGKDIFIVGGGNSAGQAAMFFSSYANSVTLLIRGENLSASMSQYLIEQIAGKRNIHIQTSTVVRSVSGGDHLEAICTQHQGQAMKMRRADALFVLIGADAVTHWLPQELQRDEHGYICTGRDVSDLPGWNGARAPFMLETNLPGFFCAGDVRHGSIKRVSSGVGEGSMAIAFVHQYLAL